MRREGKLYENHHLGLLVVVLMFVVGVVTSTSPSGSGRGGEQSTMVKKKKEVMMMRCRDNERQALLEFKKGFVDNYGILSSWGNKSSSHEEDDCCKWRGIRCSNRTGHVILLHVRAQRGIAGYQNFFLSGKISPSLLELKHLKYLNLSWNDFLGSPIPEFIGSLTKLQNLDLSSGSFAGEIPHQLGNLTNLRSLNLSWNPALTGQNLDWISHLRLLRRLDLGDVDLENSADWLQQIHKLPFLTKLYLFGCNLQGPLIPFTNSSSSIPLTTVDLSNNNFRSPLNWLFNLTSSLVHIDMHSNPLGGSVPEAFGSMLSLENIDLSSCQLEGGLPNSLKSLSRLQSLDLSHNILTGQLTEFSQTLSATEMNSLQILNLAWNKLNGYFPERFGQFPSLRALHLNNNQLQGTISEAHFSNLSKLKILDLSFNSLSLEFSLDWDPPFQLEVIRLAYCNLGSHFPKWLRSQKNLSTLDISSTGISDSIPNWFWDLTQRYNYLNISYNQIQGVIPDLSSKFVDFAIIDLSSNHFKGLIPLLPPNLQILHLSKNMFMGSVFFLCSVATKFPYSIDLSNNQLSGELPDCWMRFNQLFLLNLANNNFSGKIPTTFGFLNRLEMLQLRHNNFTGELPSSLKNCSNLILFDVSENKLSGEIPTWIGTHLTSLVVISLRKNEFYGSIPPQICYASYARVLDLSQNYISGDIPLCFNKFTSLLQTNNLNPFLLPTLINGDSFFDATYVANALVQWKRKESDFGKILGLLKLIDLSSNKLVGKIPQEFSSLEGLVSLNLSVNNLTGNIIEKIGQMKMLESLDLSKNQLSGEIPTSLASLTFLSVMDLSNNNFSGKIPSSTQLQGFSASMYTGNDKLCGLPLPKKCPEDETNILPPPIWPGKDENNEEEEDKFVTIGFYISMVLGFAIGFWGCFCPILLRSTWRHAYFRFLDKTRDWVYVTTTVNMNRLQRKLGG